VPGVSVSDTRRDSACARWRASVYKVPFGVGSRLVVMERDKVERETRSVVQITVSRTST